MSNTHETYKILVMDVDIYHTLGSIECFREKVLFINKSENKI